MNKKEKNEGKPPWKDRDQLWKTVFENIFEDFLRFVYPDADQHFDFSKGFEFLDKELPEMKPEPGKRSDSRRADKLVKVYQRNGKEEWLLVHVEVQGYHDAGFAQRMFKYFTRILDKHGHPVTVIVVFTGRERSMPDNYQYISLDTVVSFKYKAIHILDFDDRLLLIDENPFAMIVYAARQVLLRGKDVEKLRLQHKLDIVRILHERGMFSDPKLRAVLVFAKNYITFKSPELDRIFAVRSDLITGIKNSMDIQEYLAERARKVALEEAQEKEERIVSNLVTSTSLTDEQIASLAEVPVTLVKKIRRKTK